MFPVGCLFCEQDNPVGSRFCNECGKALRHRPCHACGAVIDRGASRCTRCGHEFVQAPVKEVETVAWSELESDLAEIESGLAARQFGHRSAERPPPSARAPSRSAGPAVSGVLADVEPVAGSEPLLRQPRRPVESRVLAERRVAAVEPVSIRPSLPLAPVAIESASAGSIHPAGPGRPTGSPARTGDGRRGLQRGGLVALSAVAGLAAYVLLQGTPGGGRAPVAAAGPAESADHAGSAVPGAATVSVVPATGAASPPAAAPAAAVREAGRRNPPEARACTEAVATLGLCQPVSATEAVR